MLGLGLGIELISCISNYVSGRPHKNSKTNVFVCVCVCTQVNFSGHELCFMTSHLESLKANSQERLNQLRRVWKRMREAPDSQTVIFGGDTNMRDWEVCVYAHKCLVV